MQDVTTQGSPGEDTTSETSMRDSSKKQAGVDFEELEQDSNDGSNETATSSDDVDMGAESQGGKQQVCQVSMSQSRKALFARRN